MTLYQATTIIDRVIAFYDRRDWSVLSGLTTPEIHCAAMLKIAEERVRLASRPDFEKVYAEGLKHYGTCGWTLANQPGAGEDFLICTKGIMDLKPEFAHLEQGESFGKFCRALTLDDPEYWPIVYKRLGLEWSAGLPYYIKQPETEKPASLLSRLRAGVFKRRP
ncbi:MAG: hypothetical protein ABI273_13095 [Lacunisphaera sp.]